MNKLSIVLVALLLALLPTFAETPERENPPEPCIPETPAAADGLLFARPFVLEEPYASNWSAERPLVREGLLIVLEVDASLIRARQVAEPVLYVGERTAERISWDNGSGRLVALVPGRVDLEEAPIWFGTPALPEQVDAADILRERQIAAAAGIRPFDAATVQEALARGGSEARFATRVELGRTLEELVARFVTPYAAPRP